MLEVKWSGEIRFKDNLKVYVEMAEDHTVIKAVWIDELGNEYPLGTVPSVTDLGVIDPELYDGDLMEFMNTLTETGNYRFTFDGFQYFVEVQNIVDGDYNFVYQHYWGSEEGAAADYIRGLVITDGEVERVDDVSYLTLDQANSIYAKINHSHVRFVAMSQSVWTYCNTIAMSNNTPAVIYFDTSTSRTYLIETYVGNRQPVYKMQKVTDMRDMSYFSQRSSYYYSGAEHWGDWYRFNGYTGDIKPAIMPQGGTFTVSNVASNSYSNYEVTFPEPYETAPIVVAGLASTLATYAIGNVSVSVYNVTVTGFTARVYNATSNTRNISCRYIAISS